MGDPWGTGDFRVKSIEGANRKKKSEEKSQKSAKSGEIRKSFFFSFFDWNSINSIGTDSKPLQNQKIAPKISKIGKIAKNRRLVWVRLYIAI